MNYLRPCTRRAHERDVRRQGGKEARGFFIVKYSMFHSIYEDGFVASSVAMIENINLCIHEIRSCKEKRLHAYDCVDSRFVLLENSK